MLSYRYEFNGQKKDGDWEEDYSKRKAVDGKRKPNYTK